jgi:predicted dinucleotide-utilizing enzyme
VDAGPTSFVHRARVSLGDAAAEDLGAAVTVALCSAVDHQPEPCRWPHNNQTQVVDSAVELRTVFVADASEEAEVRRLIEQALSAGNGWTVVSSGAREATGDERHLGDRLARGPRRAPD